MMKRLIISIVSITMFLMFFVSCYYDNEEALYPVLNNLCDTTNVTYSGTIFPILNNSCLGCHSVPATGGSILLSTYAEIVGCHHLLQDLLNKSRVALQCRKTSVS